jgi:hypothetical protein
LSDKVNKKAIKSTFWFEVNGIGLRKVSSNVIFDVAQGWNFKLKAILSALCDIGTTYVLQYGIGLQSIVGKLIRSKQRLLMAARTIVLI